MISHERARRLLGAAEEANDDFDILAFQQEAFPVGGDCIGTNLAALLDFMWDELRDICADLYATAA